MDCESRSILISRDEGRCLYLGISSIYDGVVEVPDPELVAVTKETSPIGIAADRGVSIDAIVALLFLPRR